MEEVLRELKLLKEELRKNELALARLDALEKQVVAREASEKEAMKKMDAIREEAAHATAEARKQIEKSRMEIARGEGVVQREHSLTVLAAMGRSIICQRTGLSYPKQFANEQDVLREYISRATLEAGATSGSYIVPTITSGEILDGLEQVSDIMDRVDFRTNLPGNIDLTFLTSRPRLRYARASVDDTMTTSDAAFSQVQLRPDEAYVYFGIDNRLLQMSAVPLGTYMLGLVRESCVEGLCDALLNADGTSSYNSIRGILNETDERYFYRMPASKTAFADLTDSDLIAVMAQTFMRGRANGVFLVSLDVLGIISQIDRKGKLGIVTYDPNGKILIWGRPVVIDEGMPRIRNSNPDKVVLGFGDLKTYVVGLVQGIQVASSTEDRFGANQTTFEAS